MEEGMITANTWFATMSKRPGPVTMTFVEFNIKHLATLRTRFRIRDGGIDKEIPPLQAFVNKGRWLVLCPKCGGGEYVWEEGWSFCCSCLNSYIGHKLRRTIFPPERAEIEKLLSVRPLANRNWNPNESVKDLKRENEEHAADLLSPAAEGG